MALDYAQTAALMADMAFRDRVKIACLHYAQYINGEDPGATAHNTRYRWAQATFTNPDNAVAQVMPALVMEGQVQADGAAISDANLQTAVEVTVNKLI